MPSWAQKDDPGTPPAGRDRLITINQSKANVDLAKELRAPLAKDDDKDDHAKEDKGRDAAERLEEQVKDLIDKLGKEFAPVGEEIRKTLEQAVREVHQSLEKEGVSVEELRRASKGLTRSCAGPSRKAVRSMRKCARQWNAHARRYARRRNVLARKCTRRWNARARRCARPCESGSKPRATST